MIKGIKKQVTKIVAVAMSAAMLAGLLPAGVMGGVQKVNAEGEVKEAISSDVVLAFDEVSADSTLTETTQLSDYFTVFATSSKSVSLKKSSSNSITIDNSTYKGKLALGGAAVFDNDSPSARIITFTTAVSATVVVYAAASNRTLVLQGPEDVKKEAATVSDGSKINYGEVLAGKYYLYSAGSGIDIYRIEVSPTEREGSNRITIDPNNGKDAYSIFLSEGEKLSDIPEADLPTKAGCDLIGWVDSTDSSIEYEKSYVPEGNLSIRAKWQVNGYEVTLVKGESKNSVLVNVGDAIAADNENIQFDERPYFKGEWINETTNQAVEFPYTPEADVTLNFVWKDTSASQKPYVWFANAEAEHTKEVDAHFGLIYDSTPLEMPKKGAYFEDPVFTEIEGKKINGLNAINAAPSSSLDTLNKKQSIAMIPLVSGHVRLYLCRQSDSKTSTLTIYDNVSYNSQTGKYEVGSSSHTICQGVLVAGREDKNISAIELDVTEHVPYVLNFANSSVGLCGIVLIPEDTKTPSITLKEASLTLDGSIGLNYYFVPTNIDMKNTTAEAVFTIAKAAGETEAEEIRVPLNTLSEEANAKGLYKVTCPLVARKVDREVTVRFEDGGNNIETKLLHGDDKTTGFTYSIAEYAAMAGDEEKTLAAAIQTYGTLAKNYLEGASEQVDVPDAARPGDEYARVVTGGADVQYVGSTLSLKAETAIKHYFKVSGNEVPSVTVDGVPVTPVKNGEQYCVTISNIPAAELGKAFTVKVNDDLTITYSAMSYVYNMWGKTEGVSNPEKLQSILKGIVNYYDKSCTYFMN